MRNWVQVRQLGGGHLLLVGLADPRTRHMARLVASQRENTEGYNYRTGAVSPFPTRVGEDILLEFSLSWGVVQMASDNLKAFLNKILRWETNIFRDPNPIREG